MADRRLTYHESSIRSFRSMVKDYTIERICAYHISGQNQPALPIGELQISGRANCALLTFCVLLELGQGRLIDIFHRIGLKDLHLGDLSSGRLEEILKERQELFPLDFDFEAFAKDFASHQWRYCPVKFELEDMKDWKPQQIIPIHKKLAINDKGFTASVWQVEVLEEFIGHDMREVISASRYQDDRDGLGWRYILALKTFKEGKKSMFEDEVKAFQTLRGHMGLIRYLGVYSHRDFVAGRNTYNILLEFGERDLDEFFFDRDHLPPVLPAEIRKFWAEIFATAPAVRDIHSFEKRREGVSREFYGWHADIKPDNILRVKEKFKLADPGFACFEQSEGEARLGNREQTTNIRGCTTTYGAPECHPGRKKRSRVFRSIDIWSLGCVFSVSATWVVLGEQGILQFTHLRELAVKQKIRHAEKTKSVSEIVTLQPGDYFHDGEEVLEEVLNWHKHLRNACRRTDTVTSRLLDVVDEHMLRKNAQDRIAAKDLCHKLDEILRESHQEHTELLPESLQQALVQIDISAPVAPSKTAALAAPKSVTLGDDKVEDRKTRKSRLLDLPLIKTAHRSEVLPAIPENISPPIPSGPSDRAVRDPARVSSNPVKPTPIQYKNSTGHGDRLDPVGGQSNLKRAPTSQSTTSSRVNGAPPVSKKQSPWQVHYDLKPLKSLRGKFPKDAEMSQYFGERDIQFLVDNADSMADHWAKAAYLLEALAIKASGQDEDGMDLYFAHGNVSSKGKKRPGIMVEKMRDPQARAVAGRGRLTDIRHPLESRFRDYLADVKKFGKQVRKLVIIIFTDGKWDGMANKHDIEDTIVEFVGRLKGAQSGYLDNRQVSFEFVQFGDDEDARHRLQRLDDELVFRHIPDIVDTEDSRGDVKKMLVGSFDAAYDSQNELIPVKSNSDSTEDGYFGSQSTPRTSVLSHHQQSQSPPQMDDYSSHNGAHHQRVDSGHAQSAFSSGDWNRTTPSIVIPQGSPSVSVQYPHYSR